jgi:transposase
MMTKQKDSAEKAIRDIRRVTRRQYSAEEKIRIVLEGLRGESSIAELCRKENINQNLYYRWSKEFLEAGKKRLAGDTAREANSDEVKGLRNEAAQLKEALAETVLENRLLVRDAGNSYLTAEGLDADDEVPMHHLLGSSITRNGFAFLLRPCGSCVRRLGPALPHLPRFLLVILCLTFFGGAVNFGVSWAIARPDHGDEPAKTAERQAQPTQESDGFRIRMASLTGVSAWHPGKFNEDQGGNRNEYKKDEKSDLCHGLSPRPEWRAKHQSIEVQVPPC